MDPDAFVTYYDMVIIIVFISIIVGVISFLVGILKVKDPCKICGCDCWSGDTCGICGARRDQ